MRKRLFLFVFISILFEVKAQVFLNDSTLKISGLLDVYYNQHWKKNGSGADNPLAFAYHRNNEINVNVALLHLAFDDGNLRGNFGLQAGTYADRNYGAEPPHYRIINEANVGVKLANKLWFDVGVMPSHIGVESFDATACYNLTRSLKADGSPYFLTAAKLTYNPNEKWELAAVLSNGWQNILNNNGKVMLGAQINYQANENITFNYSNLIGEANPVPDLWVFHDFWIEWKEIFKGFKATAVFDHLTVIDQTNVNTNSETWTTALLLYYRVNQWGIGGRAEIYKDFNNNIYSNNFNNINDLEGYSVNFDYSIAQNALLRFETRYINNVAPIFDTNDAAKGKSDLIFSVMALQLSF